MIIEDDDQQHPVHTFGYPFYQYYERDKSFLSYKFQSVALDTIHSIIDRAFHYRHIVVYDTLDTDVVLFFVKHKFLQKQNYYEVLTP